MASDKKALASRTLNHGVDARARRRERERLGRMNLHDWYVRKLLAKKHGVPPHELHEALILATRLALIVQRIANGRAAPNDMDAVLAIHDSKYAAFTADRETKLDPT